jgi:hypothetical protein
VALTGSATEVRPSCMRARIHGQGEAGRPGEPDDCGGVT